MLLYIVSLAGALMIAHMAFGGGMEVQVWIGFVGISVLVCFVLAIINIKRLQIEQHRAWMLRGWFYVSRCLFWTRLRVEANRDRLALSSRTDSS